jgi:hypothetical protein
MTPHRSSRSLNHLIGPGNERLWYHHPELPGGSLIHDEPVFPRPLDGQLGGDEGLAVSAANPFVVLDVSWRCFPGRRSYCELFPDSFATLATIENLDSRVLKQSGRLASTLGVVAAVRIDRVILALAKRHPLLRAVVEFHAHLGLSALRTVVGLQIDLLEILHA